jgi:hypothetical protein
MRAAAAALVLVATAGTGSAFADSDGYYCAGRGYLAYQFGFAAPPVGPHRLHVLRMSGAAGIGAPVVFDLPQFQVHGMLCGDRTIRIAAFNAIYTVHLDEAQAPVRLEMTPRTPDGRVPPEFVETQSRNLGAWSRVANTLTTERVPLGPVEGGGYFLLEVVGRAVESERCASTVTSRAIRTDRNGREVQQIQIFQGRGVRDCGGE